MIFSFKRLVLGGFNLGFIGSEFMGCQPAPPYHAAEQHGALLGMVHRGLRARPRPRRQGLTLIPNLAQLELFCPPYNLTWLMNVS
jgi:hypothetical protein